MQPLRRTVARPTDKETFSGRLVDILEPTADDIDFVDIAHSLAGSTRYDGHTIAPFTIAQHSVLVADLLPRPLRIHGLLHDAPEYLIGDISSPMKRSLRATIGPVFDVALHAIERRIEALIYLKAGIALPTDEEREEVKRADLTALAIEQRNLMAADNDWRLPYPSDGRDLLPLGMAESCRLFIASLGACGVSVFDLRAAA